MPTGVWKRTPEYRKAMSEALKGRIPWNKNVSFMPCQASLNNLVRNAMKGKHHSEEAKKIMSETHKRLGTRISKPFHTGKPWTEEYEKEYKRRWAEKNKEKIKIYKKLWCLKNKEKVRNSKRVAKLKRKIAGDLPINRIQMVYEDNIKRFGTLTCYICLKEIEFGLDHLEHIIPISRGGTNEYNNLGVSCKKCNLKKGNKTYEEYMKIRIVEGA